MLEVQQVHRLIKQTLLIEISEKTHPIILDLRYGTINNFTKHIIYKNPKCFLHTKALEAFEKAIHLASKEGFIFRIFDAFRPKMAQELLWKAFPNPLYVNPPDQGSMHTRGIALDLTLSFDGSDLDMGTPFDDFTQQSHHGSDLDSCILKNRYTLLGIMLSSGFCPIASEWWHYQLPFLQSYPLFQEDCGMTDTPESESQNF